MDSEFSKNSSRNSDQYFVHHMSTNQSRILDSEFTNFFQDLFTFYYLVETFDWDQNRKKPTKDPNCSPLKTTIRGRPFWPPLPYRDDIVYERHLIRNCEKIGRFRIQNWLLKCNEQDAEFSCFDDFFSFFFYVISSLFHGFLMISDWQLWWAEFQLFIQSNWPNWLWKTRVRNH